MRADYENLCERYGKGTANEKSNTHVKKGKIGIDEVSEYFPELLECDIKEIEAEIMQLA